MRLPFPFAVDGEEPEFLQRDAERVCHVFLGLPNGQIVTLELRLVGEQISQVAVARPHCAAEEPFGFHDRHDFFLFCEAQLSRGRLDLR